ncbi:MAG: 50S ribosomal protein L11 methyltransferase [Bacillota bacterium]|nr:50S ribosomal protein L11 methyltransferase [Bacillota bacterium]
MNWLEVTVQTTPQGIEHVSNRLITAGITGFQVEDEADFNDFLENNHKYWDYVDKELSENMRGKSLIKFYVSDNAAGLETLSFVKDALSTLKADFPSVSLGSLEMSISSRMEEEWADNWKKYYKPIAIGSRLLIRPVWEEIYDAGDRIVLTLNPGMSFGTGSHQTTALCLELLQKYDCDGKTMLDLGCGSGILSIAALLLGADSAVAVDIDKNAADIAAENAALNDFGLPEYETIAGNILENTDLQDKLIETKFDIITANIVADVIIPLCPLASELLNDNGIFIVSGIITERADEVKRALTEAGFDISNIMERDGWCAFSVSKLILK